MLRLFCLFAGYFLLFSVLLSSCDNGLETMVEQDEFGNTHTYERRTIDSARQGVSTITNQIGMVIEQAYYQNDTLDGPRVIFFATGDTNIIETYKMGLFDGPYRLYDDEGMLRQEGNYQDNKLTGSWKGYYEDGQLKEIVQFADNEENGPFIEYHPNGKLAAEGSYIDGDNEHGELKVYDENGDLQRSMLCDNGRCQTTWSAEITDTETTTN